MTLITSPNTYFLLRRTYHRAVTFCLARFAFSQLLIFLGRAKFAKKLASCFTLTKMTFLQELKRFLRITVFSSKCMSYEWTADVHNLQIVFLFSIYKLNKNFIIAIFAMVSLTLLERKQIEVTYFIVQAIKSLNQLAPCWLSCK